MLSPMQTLAAFLCLGLAQDPSQVIPAELRKNRHLDILAPPTGPHASTRVRATEKRITLAWRWRGGGVISSPGLTVRQKIPTVFCPTAAEAVDGSHLLVAGYDLETQRTEIELWTVAPPAAGKVTGKLEPSPIVERRSLFSSDEPGKRFVRCMFRLGKNGTQAALVQFWDSKDLYRLDFARDPAWTLVLRAEPGHLDSFPALASPAYDCFWRGDHSTFGLVYVMSDEDRFCETPALYLFDRDRDGQIDGWRTADARENELPDLCKASLYIDMYGAE
jgi:hypothetical protein